MSQLVSQLAWSDSLTVSERTSCVRDPGSSPGQAAAADTAMGGENDVKPRLCL